MENFKNKKLHKITYLFVFIFIFIFLINIGFTKTASADYKLLAPIGSNYTSVSSTDIGGYFNKIFTVAIGIAGVLAVVMLVVGGIEWMGSESVFKKSAGKEKITSALLGLLIALGSYAILKTINPDLLGKKTISTTPKDSGVKPNTSKIEK